MRAWPIIFARTCTVGRRNVPFHGQPASLPACLPAVYACKRVFAYQFSSLPPYLPNNTLTMPAAATLALADHGDSVRMIGAATPPV